MENNNIKKFIITTIFLLSTLISINMIWAETNGVWHFAEDIIPGVVGEDQGNPTGNYTFIHDVYFNSDMHLGNVKDTTNPYYVLDLDSRSILKEIQAEIYFDDDDTSYYLDPASTSVLNEIKTRKIIDLDDENYYLDPSGVSVFQQINVSVFKDSDNNDYYIDPASRSIFNQIDARLFRDLDDPTNYYVDPSGNSYFNVIYANKFLYRSDIRYKKDVQELDNSYDKLMNLHGVKYKWISDNSDDIGFIAQDVEKVLPEIVYEDNNGMKTVDYAKMLPIIVETIKEQDKKINELQKEIDRLKNES